MRDKFFRQIADMQARDAGMAPFAAPIADQSRRAVQLHYLAREEAQMLPRFLDRARLVEPPTLGDHQRVRTQHQRLWMERRDSRRLGDRQCFSHFGRRGTLQPRLNRAFINIGGDALVSDTSSIEHRPARGGFAGENQTLVHIGFPTPPSLAGLRSRSCASRMMAAAVSSIERRVTSITGQPLSPNIRRAYCSSAFTRSLST